MTNEEEDLAPWEQFALVKDLYTNTGLIFSKWERASGSSSNVFMLCGYCLESKRNRFTTIVNPTLEDFLSVKRCGGYCWCCESLVLNAARILEDVNYRVVEAKAKAEKEISDKKALEIVRLEKLARSGDLIAFHEWKKLTGN